LSYGADALRYATTTGQIYRRAPDGSVTREASFTGRRFFDLAMSPDGTKGLAAADGGRLYRLQNGTWSSVSLAGTTFAYSQCRDTPSTTLPRIAAPTADVRAVAWSS